MLDVRLKLEDLSNPNLCLTDFEGHDRPLTVIVLRAVNAEGEVEEVWRECQTPEVSG